MQITLPNTILPPIIRLYVLRTCIPLRMNPSWNYFECLADTARHLAALALSTVDPGEGVLFSPCNPKSGNPEGHRHHGIPMTEPRSTQYRANHNLCSSPL